MDSHQFTQLLLALFGVVVVLQQQEVEAFRNVDPLDTPQEGDLSKKMNSSIIRFRGLSSDVWKPLNDSSGLLEVHQSFYRNATALSVEQRDANWEVEKAFFLQQAAVQQEWYKTFQVFDYANTEPATMVQTIKGNAVPGLDGVSFGEVFDLLARNGCPIWLIGGTVRDLLSKRIPNDVDVAALCDSYKLNEILSATPWKHQSTPPDAYFSVGDAHGDDPDYLEGFTIDLVFNDPFTAETSVNCLLWSLTHDYVIDATGKGVTDALANFLRPGSPDARERGPDIQWKVWHQWTFGAFAAPQFQRHVRYMKMRLRGWEPFCECYQIFMANMLYVMSQVEANPRKDCPSTVDGETWPCSSGGLLLLLADKMDEKDTDKSRQVIDSFFTILEEDISSYFSAGRDKLQKCSGSTQMALSRHGEVTDWRQVVQGALVQPCTDPTKKVSDSILKQGKGPAVHFLCTLILDKFEQIGGFADLGGPPSAGPAEAMARARAPTHRIVPVPQRVTYTIPRLVPVRTTVVALPADAVRAAVQVRLVPVPPAQARQAPTVVVGPMQAFSARRV